MNAFYQAKFDDLFIEFTRYLTEHPELDDQIPENAEVVLLDRHDPQYSQYALELAQRSRSTDDVPDRPVIYIEVTELAPAHSRVQGLKVHERPPAYSV